MDLNACHEQQSGISAHDLRRTYDHRYIFVERQLAGGNAKYFVTELTVTELTFWHVSVA